MGIMGHPVAYGSALVKACGVLCCIHEAITKPDMKRINFLACLLALPAAADGTYPSGKTVDCYCTDRNHNRIEIGETICLQVDGRMFMAQCQMSLNVPMWREVQQGCLSSSLERAEPAFNALTVYPQI